MPIISVVCMAQYRTTYRKIGALLYRSNGGTKWDNTGDTSNPNRWGIVYVGHTHRGITISLWLSV